MSSFKGLYNADLCRYSGSIPRYVKKWDYLFRKSSTSSGLIHKIYHILFISVSNAHGIEISDQTQIGGGIYIGHPYSITINPEAIIGSNCNIHRGVLIGKENRGKREGAPIIGNNVWIGINAAIVGNVNVGDDVLIAPNSYVNCDIPAHSIVLGNPCTIIHKERATFEYIKNTSEMHDE